MSRFQGFSIEELRTILVMAGDRYRLDELNFPTQARDFAYAQVMLARIHLIEKEGCKPRSYKYRSSVRNYCQFCAKKLVPKQRKQIIRHLREKFPSYFLP